LDGNKKDGKKKKNKTDSRLNLFVSYNFCRRSLRISYINQKDIYIKPKTQMQTIDKVFI